jgi:N-acetylgalactosamine kinase
MLRTGRGVPVGLPDCSPRRAQALENGGACGRIHAVLRERGIVMSASQALPELVGRFVSEFGGRRPTWFISAPGRINLIGEHTDYNGFPVMPMAITLAIRMLLAPREDAQVELKDVADSVYGGRQFALSQVIRPYAAGDWGNYVKAAVQSLVELALGKGRTLEDLKGMCCLVDGNIPPAAGLSSSTALVVAAGMAFCAVNRLGLGRHAMAERMAEAEHYVGTQGGGMDQAVCLLAREGHVVKIGFFPLRAEQLPLARDYVIVAAHSTINAKKTGDLRLQYNRRVLECNIGAQLLARRLDMTPPARLADLARPGGKSLGELLALLDEVLTGQESLSLRRAAEIFDMDPGRFARQFLRMKDGRLLPMPGDGLKVLRRCRHVLTEAGRTEQAAACLKREDMAELGHLIDESHRSCAEDYEISCYELDLLVELMRGAGALGARLTGAGFGGFAIGLVHRDTAPQVKAALERSFYAPRRLSSGENVFVFHPAAGALEEPLHAPMG